MNRRPHPQAPTPGVIRADELYTLEEIRNRLRLGNKGIAIAQRNGLRTVQVGRGKVCFGGDVIAWVKRLAEAEAGGGKES